MNDPDGLAAEAEAKATLLLRLRAGGIADLDVLRAMEAVPRGLFLPRSHVALAGRDIALPLGCGQTTQRPSFIARLLAGLACTAEHRVLEVGSGSGFVTALLSRLAESVVGMERFQTLAAGARRRLADLGFTNASVDWADGLASPGCPGRFERVVVHAALDAPPVSLLDILSPEGLLVYPLVMPHGSPGAGRQMMLRMSRDRDGTLHQTHLCACRLQAAQHGRSRVL